MMERIKVGGGVALVALSAILSPPLMTRFWDESQLTLASSAILAHGLMGALDFFKPIIIRRVATNPYFATLKNILIPSVFSSIIMSIILTYIGLVFLPELYFYLILSVALSVIIYGIYSPFWGVLNASLRVSDTYLIRSLSVAFLYGALGVGALIGRDEVIYASLILANLIPALMFIWLSRGLIKIGGWSVDSKYWIEIFNVFIQNIARSVNDFGDRLAAMFFLPASYGGKYIIVSDIASRANFITQLITIQSYPILCKHHEKARLFLLAGVSISSLVILFSVVLLFFGEGLYTWYLGEKMRGFFWVFCCLLSSFGVHTLGYFGQAILRSRSMDRSLTASLLVPAFMCIIYLLAFANSFDLNNIIILMAISKIGAFFMMARLLKTYPAYAVSGMMCCMISWGFVAYVLETVPPGGGYGLS